MDNTELLASYEETLIAQVLHKPSIIDDLLLTENLFNSPDYRTIFSAIEMARREFAKADLISVCDILKRKGRDDLVIKAASISPISTANAKFYAGELREEHQREQVSHVVLWALGELKDITKPVNEISDTIMADITSAMRGVAENELPIMNNIVLPYISALNKKISARRSGITSPITFGLRSIDTLISEIRGGEVIVIAGRPGAGKTALALQMACNISITDKVPTMFVSMEMLRDEVIDRIFAQTGIVTVGMIRGGYLRDEQIDEIQKLSNELYEAPLSIYDGNQTLRLLRSRIRREKAIHDIKVVVIDYLGLIDMNSESRIPRWERMAEVSRTLKLLALELGVVIVEVVQMNREADGQEPTLASLRDSGAIEQDADRVLLLFEKEKPSGDARQVAVYVAKNRHGPCGKVLLMFNGRHVKFSEEVDR